MLSIHYINKDIGKVFRWVASGASTDKKNIYQLRMIHVKSPIVEASDGFMILRAEFEEPQRLRDIIGTDGLYQLCGMSTGYMVLEADGLNLLYPDTQSIVDGAVNAKGTVRVSRQSEPTDMSVEFSIAIDATQIAKAMSIMPARSLTYLHFGREVDAVLIQNELDAGVFGKVKLIAVVMPMSASGYSADKGFSYGYSLKYAR